MLSIAEQFHELYYESRVWEKTFWLGTEAHKCPLDLWIYQEILFQVRLRFIIESGTVAGGSALFLASICDLLGDGTVITIDIENRPDRPDTNVNGHPVLPEHGPGPMEAVALSLRENEQFAPDRKREKFLMTFNPGGFLKKIAD